MKWKSTASLTALAGLALLAACADSPTSVGPGRSARPSLYTGTISGGDVNLGGGPGGGGPLSGAIFTSGAPAGGVCTGVDLNIYADKDAVYLNGGPSHPGAAGLPDGEYYVAVTAPDGSLLGWSNDMGDPTPVTVTGGEFADCYQLSSIVERASALQGGSHVAGYDDTPNGGGVYKVWVSSSAGFEGSASKTDNFKVKSTGGGPPPFGRLTVIKYYDANLNGVFDETDPTSPESQIVGWKVRIVDGIDIFRFTPVSILVDPDDYTVSELDPIQTNWIATTPKSFTVTVPDGGTAAVEFGNVCLGPGNGHTLGYMSNKNGQSYIQKKYGTGALFKLGGSDIDLKLRNANGTFALYSAGGSSHPGFSSYNNFRSWLLNATATNMAYMLSAQYVTMYLNVNLAGTVVGGVPYAGVSPSALVYAPALDGFSQSEPLVNALGFITVADLLGAAQAELALHGRTTEGGVDAAFRAYQEALKTALDRGNNNLNFLQSAPCAFSF